MSAQRQLTDLTDRLVKNNNIERLDEHTVEITDNDFGDLFTVACSITTMNTDFSKLFAGLDQSKKEEVKLKLAELLSNIGGFLESLMYEETSPIYKYKDKKHRS